MVAEGWGKTAGEQEVRATGYRVMTSVTLKVLKGGGGVNQDQGITIPILPKLTT